MTRRKRVRRGFGWRPDTPDKRDKYLQINYFRRFSIALPSEYDAIRPRMPPCEDQDTLGCCTGFGIAAAIQYGHIKQDKAPFSPSQLFIYYNERVLEKTVAIDAGAEIRDGIKSLGRWGVCSSDAWPYRIDRFTKRPSVLAYVKAWKDIIRDYQRVPQTVDYLKATLAVRGLPIVFGFTCYESFDTPAVEKSGTVPMPKTKEAVIGGHCVLMVGYTSDNHFIFRNSYGTGWGNKGYGYLPFDYATNEDLSADYWCINTVH